jgi:hypothetical protein
VPRVTTLLLLVLLLLLPLLLPLQIKKYEHEQKAVQDFKAREEAMVRPR